MHKFISACLLTFLIFYSPALAKTLVAETQIETSEDAKQVVSQRRGRGSYRRSSPSRTRVRSSPSRARQNYPNRSTRSNYNRSRMTGNSSNRINRQNVNQNSPRQVNTNRGNFNLDGDTRRSNRIDRTNNQNRNRTVDRTNLDNRQTDRTNLNNRQTDRTNLNNRQTDRTNLDNRQIDRTNLDNRQIDRSRRELDLNRERNLSNRIDRNRVNIGNRIGDRNVVVNRNNINGTPWGWNYGRTWYPNYGYWGGGFWGAFAGSFTGALIGSAINDNDNYVIVQENSPGYLLLDGYSLTQTRCEGNVVIINGPNDSIICARPTNDFPAGTYYVDTSTLTLVPK